MQISSGPRELKVCRSRAWGTKVVPPAATELWSRLCAQAPLEDVRRLSCSEGSRESMTYRSSFISGFNMTHSKPDVLKWTCRIYIIFCWWLVRTTSNLKKWSTRMRCDMMLNSRLRPLRCPRILLITKAKLNSEIFKNAKGQCWIRTNQAHKQIKILQCRPTLCEFLWFVWTRMLFEERKGV